MQYGGGTDDCSPAGRYLGNLAPGVFALGEHYSHLVVVLPFVKEEVTQALKMYLLIILYTIEYLLVQILPSILPDFEINCMITKTCLMN